MLTDEEWLWMAQACGLDPIAAMPSGQVWKRPLSEFVRRIESRARADALEEAAKVCETKPQWGDGRAERECAAAIRALATGRK